MSSKALQKGKELHLVIEKYPTYQLAYKVGLLVGAVPAAAYTITLASSALTAASIGLAVFTTVLITATTVLLVVVIAVATTAATISAAVLSVGIAAEKLKLGGGGGNRLAIVGATTPGGKPLIRSDIQAKAIEKVDTITGKLIAFAHSAADFLINRLT